MNLKIILLNSVREAAPMCGLVECKNLLVEKYLPFVDDEHFENRVLMFYVAFSYT